MKKLLIVLVAAIIVGVSVHTLNTYNASSSNSNLSVENTDKSSPNQNNAPTKPIGINPKASKTKATDFKLKDLEGKELSLSDLKGKKVFLNFWATWCPPCRSEMPEIEKLYQETKDSDLVIVAIEIGEPLDTVKSFIDSNNYNFKVLSDPDQIVAAQYNIASIPTSYFIDVDGNIISKHYGAMNIDQMKEYIKTLDK
ncbi:TlpA family protein disulfide reductase [Clostridium sp. CM028]|uniref:TlpA family protein disulfide reductase n=1 Tax=unclassified Clostridium TaxID=2614128 RepID=UPI001C6DFF9B|nr:MULTISPECIES: TlpA disulfide reductase family protein [unclassified Clostridium]MBW9145932.1 TlpA family protein disulfide reductase [Clostridium sp. CM027]MBW9149619.1 TlpA family protein disulfide reductase [Clostridium sp. CM028]UVE40908.1 TlpA family protein disulfide reductase [Clostridium sp. CM027]WLC61575.1 TlpA family protein disulfide reductase [Clostridium sp. CM028]